MSAHASKKSWWLLTGILAAAGVLVWLAPAERTIGQGIKIVYIHVSLIWAGMVGVILSGILGIGLIFVPSKKLEDWTTLIGWVALVWFALGVATSLLAAKINWGAVYWNEPRVISSVHFLAVAVIVQIARNWLPWVHMRGALSAALPFYLMWSTIGTPLILHPSSPIRESSSFAIQLTFLGMFIFSCLIAGWAVWYVRKMKP
jgi:hypothetical protein